MDSSSPSDVDPKAAHRAAPRVLVTRPAREAAQWVADLRAHGLDAVALPLMAIAPVPDPEPVRAAWRQLAGYAAVMFVSGNAVAHFFEWRDPAVLAAWVSGELPARAWSPGPGTSAALLGAGLAAERIDAPAPDAAQFDSEALWAQVGGQLRAQPLPAGPPGKAGGSRVLIVRGGDAGGSASGRDWLAAQLAAQGVTVDTVCVYRREAPQFDAAQRALAQQAAVDGSVWLFSSSQAVHNLQSGLPAQDWSRARALATHPRIAQAARRAGFADVGLTRPALQEVLASIESLA